MNFEKHCNAIANKFSKTALVLRFNLQVYPFVPSFVVAVRYTFMY